MLSTIKWLSSYKNKFHFLILLMVEVQKLHIHRSTLKTFLVGVKLSIVWWYISNHFDMAIDWYILLFHRKLTLLHFFWLASCMPTSGSYPRHLVKFCEKRKENPFTSLLLTYFFLLCFLIPSSFHVSYLFTGVTFQVIA